jgi:hypothetical protein
MSGPTRTLAQAGAHAGEVILTDRTTGYEMLHIPAGQIADVQVKKFSQIITDTRHSGRTTVGGFGGALGMAYTMGGRSTSVTQSQDDYVLEVRYQPERNGAVRTVVIPGGSDHRVVEELCALVRRLEA